MNSNRTDLLLSGWNWPIYVEK